MKSGDNGEDVYKRQVLECAVAGADIATVPFSVLKKMFHHPLTDKGIEQFKKDWENAVT